MRAQPDRIWGRVTIGLGKGYRCQGQIFTPDFLQLGFWIFYAKIKLKTASSVLRTFLSIYESKRKLCLKYKYSICVMWGPKPEIWNLNVTLWKVHDEHVNTLILRCSRIIELDLDDTEITNDSVTGIIENLKSR